MSYGEVGTRIRELRANDGWRQQDVAERLGLSRSALANIEAGRERPSQRVLDAISTEFPEWAPYLSDSREPDGAQLHGGPFVLEDLTIAYIFEEARSPNEIVEVRTVRSTRAGASGYVLSSRRTDPAGGSSPDVVYSLVTEVLWGGYLVDDQFVDDDGAVEHRRVIHFGRQLRRGERHSFAIRSWTERDSEPGTCILVDYTVPVGRVGIHLTCHGRPQLARAWAFGPRVDDAELPADSADVTPVDVTVGGTATLVLEQPELERNYGLAWEWR